MSASANPLYLLESYKTYGSSFMNLEIWEPFVRQVCQRHHLHPSESIGTGVAGSYPTFIVADRWVVKFFGQLFGGEESYIAERNANYLIADQAEILAPAVLTTDHLFDEDAPWRWPYLIFDFVPGNSIGEVYDRVSFEDKLELSRQLGQITGKMHRLSIAKIPIYAEKGWESYANFLMNQQQICVRNHQKWGSLSERLIAQIQDYLLPVKEIIDFENSPSLIHADITRDHILGQVKDSRWETKALIDYSDAMIGDIFYELAALHLDTFQCDRRLLKSFLEVYGLSAHQKQDFIRKAMSVALLHQFDVFYGIHTHQSESIDRLETLANQLWKIDT